MRKRDSAYSAGYQAGFDWYKEACVHSQRGRMEAEGAAAELADFGDTHPDGILAWLEWHGQYWDTSLQKIFSAARKSKDRSFYLKGFQEGVIAADKRYFEEEIRDS